MVKTNYFGTFLDTLNMPTTTPTPTPGGLAGLPMKVAPTPSIDTLLKIWPDNAAMTVADVADTFNLSVDAAADLLIKIQGAGIAANKAGKFNLTPVGIDLLKKVKPL